MLSVKKEMELLAEKGSKKRERCMDRSMDRYTGRSKYRFPFLESAICRILMVSRETQGRGRGGEGRGDSYFTANNEQRTPNRFASVAVPRSLLGLMLVGIPVGTHACTSHPER